MTVQETDDLGRPLGNLVVLVSSRRGQPAWQCDLGSYSGLGACRCEDFLMCKMAEIKKAKLMGEFKPDDRFRCAHLIFARREMFKKWGEQIITELRKTNNYRSEEE